LLGNAARFRVQVGKLNIYGYYSVF
jgi:hypothetical protein